MTEILRVAGAVAGVGGLAIATLLLIYRQIIARINPPGNPSEEKYFKTINLIIIFTFIVATIGIIIYAILDISHRADAAARNAQEATAKAAQLEGQYSSLSTKYETLNTSYATLNKQYLEQKGFVDTLVEPALKVRSSGIEIARTEVAFDFTKWTLVPEPIRYTEKKSEVTLRTKRVITRAQHEANKFHATYATSSPFEPVFKCRTHKLTPIPNKDPFPPGKEALHRWILEYDISNVNMFEDTPIETEITSWNTHQNPTRESEETLILYPTRTACLVMQFGEGKRPMVGSIECSTYRLALGESPVLVRSHEVAIGAGNAFVSWEIGAPRLGHHYRIEWKW